ncbi:MAG: hypothetical protein WAX89_01355 [Alphaproteobacteria bacterium]
MFLYTITLTAHHNFAGNVVGVLQQLLADTLQVHAHTPLHHRKLVHSSLITVDAILGLKETFIDHVRQELAPAHPKVERGAMARTVAQTLAALREHEHRPEFRHEIDILPQRGEYWLPEISVSLLSNHPQQAQATFAHWQALPHNQHA